MMTKPKSLEVGQWKKNEMSESQCHPKVTFDILMPKYREGRVGIREHEN
jgi:hypothetical protein